MKIFNSILKIYQDILVNILTQNMVKQKLIKTHDTIEKNFKNNIINNNKCFKLYIYDIIFDNNTMCGYKI